MEKINLKQPLFLCGMMGSGKSTVGNTLSSMLNVPFYDLDSMIIDEAGMTIPQIFEQKGEKWFRDLEQTLLLRKSKRMSGIMALGGGALQNQRIVDHLKIYGWLIFLNAPKSVILERVTGDQNRPKLADGKDSKEQLKKTIATLIDKRIPFYNQAQITIHTADSTPEEIAENILKKIKIYDGFNRR